MEIGGVHPMESVRKRKNRVSKILERLTEIYDTARCTLDHDNTYQLLVATILAAQCTDKRVNLVTPDLFRKYPDPAALAKADRTELIEIIRSTGFFRNKTSNLIACATDLVRLFGGEVPGELEKLVKLKGVGRKTANVVLGNSFGVPGVVVDTHVKRLSGRLALSDNTDPGKIERDLMEVVPRSHWTLFSHLLVFHGREICRARHPVCASCLINKWCPHGQEIVSLAVE